MFSPIVLFLAQLESAFPRMREMIEGGVPVHGVSRGR